MYMVVSGRHNVRACVLPMQTQSQIKIFPTLLTIIFLAHVCTSTGYAKPTRHVCVNHARVHNADSDALLP